MGKREMNMPGRNWIGKSGLILDGVKGEKTDPHSVLSILESWLRKYALLRKGNTPVTQLLKNAWISKEDLCWNSGQWVQTCSTYLNPAERGSAVAGIFARLDLRAESNFFAVLAGKDFTIKARGDFLGEFRIESDQDGSWEVIGSGHQGTARFLGGTLAGGNAPTSLDLKFEVNRNIRKVYAPNRHCSWEIYLDGCAPKGLRARARAALARKCVGWQAMDKILTEDFEAEDGKLLYLLFHLWVGSYRTPDPVAPG